MIRPALISRTRTRTRDLALGSLTALALTALPTGLVQADVIGFTDATFSVTGMINNTADITSFTTSGLNDALAGVTSTANVDTAETPPGPVGESGIRNLWGSAGSEIDGPASGLGLDVGHGFSNLTIGDFFFDPITSAPGEGNDLFILEVGNGEDITVTALDELGNTLGTALDITAGQFGDTGTNITFRVDNITDSLVSGALGPANISGVGFDLDDLGVTSGSIAGLRITGTDSGDSIDLLVVGTNVIPEPTSAALLALGGLALVARRRRHA